jgi:hypothetical protein
VSRAVHAGGLTFLLRESRKELYPPCTMTSNNTEWERGWFYLCNDSVGLPVHRQGVEGEDRHLASRCIAFLAPAATGVAHRHVAEPGECRFGAASILANLHDRRIIEGPIRRPERGGVNGSR